eukprot:sb/3470553/
MWKRTRLRSSETLKFSTLLFEFLKFLKLTSKTSKTSAGPPPSVYTMSLLCYEEEDKTEEFRDVQESCLAEALLTRILISHQKSAEISDEQNKEPPSKSELEERSVVVLAAVQERQEQEGETTLTKINSMNIGQLSEIRQIIHGDTAAGMFDNLALELLGEVTEADMAARTSSVRDQFANVFNLFHQKMKARMEAKKCWSLIG